MVHVGAVHVPVLGVTEPIVKPAGRASSMLTFVAWAGPLFVTVTVKVTVSPSSGVPLSTIFVMTRSVALPTVIDSLRSSAVVSLST